jgi:HPt (histidine-containing phosphotransfer) domain-containing protein
MNGTTICDFPGAMEALEDEDGEILLELAGIALEDMPKLTATILAALAAQDGPALAASAHRLKGSAANFCAHEVCRLMQQIEQAAHASDFDAARELCVQLEPLMARCRAEFQEFRASR